MTAGVSKERLLSRPDEATRFKPGQSGNLSGPKPGSRNKLGEAFLDALHTDFEANGVAAILSMRENGPSAYLRVVASLMPKEVSLDQKSPIAEMDNETLNREIERLTKKMGYVKVA